jgi:hypothetical protein
MKEDDSDGRLWRRVIGLEKKEMRSNAMKSCYRERKGEADEELADASKV